MKDNTKNPLQEKITTEIEVRFSDLDLYGHVNNVAYFSYLETARVKLFKDVFNSLTKEGVFLVVARAECDYILPIPFLDKVFVSLWIDKIGRKSFDISYEIHSGGKIFAKAKTTLVSVEGKTGKAIDLPKNLLEGRRWDI